MPTSHIALLINKILEKADEIVIKSIKPLENSWFHWHLTCGFFFFLPLPIHRIDLGNSLLKMWLITQSQYTCGNDRTLTDDQKDNSVLINQKPMLWFFFTFNVTLRSLKSYQYISFCQRTWKSSIYHLPNEPVIFHNIFMFFPSFNWKAFGRKVKSMISLCSLKGKLRVFLEDLSLFFIFPLLLILDL